MSKRIVGIVLGVILVGLAWWLRTRDRAPETPEAAVNALFDAASRGDDRAYLALLAGPLKTSLQETRSQLGAARFREELRASTAKIKGLALSPSPSAPPDRVALDAVLVFADREEHQRFVLAPQGRGWVITDISHAAAKKPAIPYGTPVFEP